MPLTLRLAGIWVIYACWASATGWTLSLLGQLDGPGYAVAAVAFLLLATVFWKATAGKGRPRLRPWRSWPWSRRAWVLVSILVFAGGMLNPPSNYDALTYRVPRVLYWLQEGHWHWIGATNFRMDIAGSGFEWMSAPWMLLTRTDRHLWLLNALPFLLLPGLFFHGARGLGVAGSAARWWMWVWPMAYGCALQAGSVGNDLAAIPLLLAAVSFAVESRRGRPALCLSLSLLAMAATSAIKVTFLPLVLPVGLVWLCFALPRLRGRAVLALALVALACIPCSFLPTAVLNWKYTGTWSGNPGNRLGVEVQDPLAGLVGNGLNVALGAAQPPLLPAAGTVNAAISRHVEAQSWRSWLRDHYPACQIGAGGEIPQEESAGIGIGVLVALLAWRLASKPDSPRGRLWGMITVGTAIAGMAFLMRVGGGSAARLLVPFIPLVVIAVIGGRRLKRRRDLPALAVFPALCVLPALLLTPSRPLIPSRFFSLIPGLPAAFRDRIETVYRTYGHRADILAPLRSAVPADAPVGFGGDDDHSPIALFRPFGSRRVEEITPNTIDRVNWIVGTEEGLKDRLGDDALLLLERHGFQRKSSVTITSKVSAGPEPWNVLQRPSDGAPDASTGGGN